MLRIVLSACILMWSLNNFGQTNASGVNKGSITYKWGEEVKSIDKNASCPTQMVRVGDNYYALLFPGQAMSIDGATKRIIVGYNDNSLAPKFQMPLQLADAGNKLAATRLVSFHNQLYVLAMGYDKKTRGGIMYAVKLDMKRGTQVGEAIKLMDFDPFAEVVKTEIGSSNFSIVYSPDSSKILVSTNNGSLAGRGGNQKINTAVFDNDFKKVWANTAEGKYELGGFAVNNDGTAAAFVFYGQPDITGISLRAWSADGEGQKETKISVGHKYFQTYMTEAGGDHFNSVLIYGDSKKAAAGLIFTQVDSRANISINKDVAFDENVFIALDRIDNKSKKEKGDWICQVLHIMEDKDGGITILCSDERATPNYSKYSDLPDLISKPNNPILVHIKSGKGDDKNWMTAIKTKRFESYQGGDLASCFAFYKGDNLYLFCNDQMANIDGIENKANSEKPIPIMIIVSPDGNYKKVVLGDYKGFGVSPTRIYPTRNDEFVTFGHNSLTNGNALGQVKISMQ